jgi:hypothetical protein
LTFSGIICRGRGLGTLPALEGEAHGVVGVSGAGTGVLRVVGASVGEHHGAFPDDFDLLLMLAAAA